MSILSPTNVIHAYHAGGPLRDGTFTRSGAAYHRNRLGYLASTASGVPRTEWRDEDSDGVAETPTLCLERGVTNELTQSADLTHADWATTGLSARNANQATDPEGNTTLDELVENSALSNHGVGQTVTLTADANYALSCWAIANTRTWLQLKLADVGTPANNVDAFYNLGTGAVGDIRDNGTGVGVRHYMEDWTHMAAGLYRCVLVAAVNNSATSVNAYIQMATGNLTANYTGDGSSSVYAGYAQLEDSVEIASEYVPTTTASASVDADLLAFPWPLKPVRPFTRYTRWYDGMYGDGGTTGASNYPRIWEIGGATRLGLFWTKTDKLVLVHTNAGVDDDVTQGSITVSRGDLCEAVVTWVGDGNATAVLWINGTQSASLSLAASVGVAAAWDDEFTALNSRYDGSQTGSMRLVHDVAVSGVLAGSNASLLSQMRGLRTAVGTVT